MDPIAVLCYDFSISSLALWRAKFRRNTWCRTRAPYWFSLLSQSLFHSWFVFHPNLVSNWAASTTYFLLMQSRCFTCFHVLIVHMAILMPFNPYAWGLHYACMISCLCWKDEFFKESIWSLSGQSELTVLLNTSIKKNTYKYMISA